MEWVQEMLLDPRPGRLFHTHLPYTNLPESVARSRCKLVYVARNPEDTVVSMWHFYNKFHRAEFPLERAVESFCSGVVPWGPFYEHLVGYWEESKRRPEEVLFLKYEDLVRDPKKQVRELASFLGKPFCPGGDGDEVVDKVLWRSSLERLKELDINKNGIEKQKQRPNTIFFRKGAVGDWKNYMMAEMAQRIDRLTQTKLHGTGLSLDDYILG
ncbi:unnamed protein product [Linum tenue]|uniref:Sulfotransferase n=2 Tax=Linum tenue TaxID=586396 RepID=A0AAV0QGP9_9ROSI|nr:unnamed protein product [Linum tenue]